MKKLLLFVITILLVYSAHCQATIVDNKEELTSTLANIDSVSKTFCMKVNYLSFGKSNSYEILRRLSDKNLVKEQYYRSAIQFMLKNDTTDYYLPIKKVNDNVAKQLVNTENKNKTVLLKIKAFKNFRSFNNRPFFLIESIQFIN